MMLVPSVYNFTARCNQTIICSHYLPTKQFLGSALVEWYATRTLSIPHSNGLQPLGEKEIISFAWNHGATVFTGAHTEVEARL
jgi:hypothetical protein